MRHCWRLTLSWHGSLRSRRRYLHTRRIPSLCNVRVRSGWWRWHTVLNMIMRMTMMLLLHHNRRPKLRRITRPRRQRRPINQMTLIQRQLPLLLRSHPILILDHKHIHLKRKRFANHLYGPHFTLRRPLCFLERGFLLFSHVLEFLGRLRLRPEFGEEGALCDGLACACERGSENTAAAYVLPFCVVEVVGLRRGEHGEGRAVCEFVGENEGCRFLNGGRRLGCRCLRRRSRGCLC